MTRLHKLVLHNPLVPWRLRTMLETRLENIARERFPALYEFAHFGRLHNIVKPVTQGPKHHFFGYYDKSPWNESGRLLLAHEAGFNDRPPRLQDSVDIGVVHLADGCRFERLATVHAWNWQQGAMPQWHPQSTECDFFHNDRQAGHFVGVLRNSDGKVLNQYARPIYAVTPDGRYGFSLNFARLQIHRPGYGYSGGIDPYADEFAPAQDGIHRIDLTTGDSILLVSLAQLAGLDPHDEMQGVHHWVNHIQASPTSRRFAFFHLWRRADSGWGGRLFTMDTDGRNLKCVLDGGMVSHYDWMDDDNILIWARQPMVGDRFFLCNVMNGAIRVIGESVLTEDGHCSFSPDRHWVLNDTYPDRFGMRVLMLYHLANDKRIDIARLYSPKERWWGEIRCDLHPRWSRDGRSVCVDSVHSGERQIYVADVGSLLR